jgi:hypothetical protein
MSLLREKFMRAVLARALEAVEKERRENLARRVWLTGVLKLWDARKHRTLGKFLQTRAGRLFRRRASIVTAK